MGCSWPFGRMGVVICVILMFRSQKCEHFFSDPNPPISHLVLYDGAPNIIFVYFFYHCLVGGEAALTCSQPDGQGGASSLHVVVKKL